MGGNHGAAPETNRARNAVAGVLAAGALLLAPIGVALTTPGVADAAPGGCSSSCTVGGVDPANPGDAQGGRAVQAFSGLAVTQSGSGVVQGGQQAGHSAVTYGDQSGTISGNFTTVPKGHCTGIAAGVC